jgi:hypothetical protein
MDKDGLVGFIAVPPVVGAALWVGVLLITALTGRHPIWPLEPQNLSEAVALRDGGAAVRRAEAGEDVNRAADVRARLIQDDAAMLTPIEAAAGARDEAMAQLVIDLGASPDAAVWHRAFCISDADGVRDVLKAHKPSGAVEDCR